MTEKQSKRRNPNKRKRSSAASYQLVYTAFLEPSRGEEEKPILPDFKPMKMMKILREKTGGTAIVASAEVTEEIFDRIQAEQVELLQALGLDATKPDYAQAFLELAKIHHGLGVVQLEPARAPNKNAEKWTVEQDDDLVRAVKVRQLSGMSISAALKDIANEEAVWTMFPGVKHSRSEKPAAFLRAQNYRRRLAFIHKREDLETAQREIIDSLVATTAGPKTP